MKRKKIEQKPWSEEDEEIIDALISFCNAAKEAHPKISVGALVDWLKSLKDRVQPKQEWSEEDENRVNRLIAYFEDKESFTAEDDIVYANWLKSLKERYIWKPSDEQITVLELASKYERVFTPKQIDILIGLKEHLKKLREE